MAKLKDKVENALNETRILILGGQVLIGFSYRAYFEPVFEQLGHKSQVLLTIGLGIMLAGIGVLLTPASYHRLVEHGEVTERLHVVVSAVLGIGLLPFAIALGTDLYVVGVVVGGPTWAWFTGVVSFASAMFAWYVLELVMRGRKREFRLTSVVSAHEETMPESERKRESSLTEKIKEALIEARMVLPGAQALLGFQFIIVLMDRFTHIPKSSQYIHFASLCATALSTIILIMPAAYHRIVYHGEDSEEFHRAAGRMLLTAMVFIGLGTCGDFLVVCRIVTKSFVTSIVLSLELLGFFYGLWFGWTAYRRQKLAEQ